MNKQRNYYLGLDIGTDSVGYAVTDEEYNLLKFHGEPAWGVTIFDAGSLNDERRAHRSDRRRLDRRQQRVSLVQELFAKEIAKVDERFFIRLKESRLFRDEVGDQFTLFNDANFTDKEYYEKYPTIHHLIVDLMNSEDPHDVRLVYLACAWLVSHRGHFLSNIDKNNLSEIKDFDIVYENFVSYFANNGYALPWKCEDTKKLGDILKAKTGITKKNKELVELLLNGSKPSKVAMEDFPFSTEAVIKLLAGGTCALKDIYLNDEYADFGSISLGADDEKFGEVMANIGEDYDLIAALRSLYDWAILVDVMGGFQTISEAKVATYEQHKKDLATLKYFVKKYIPDKYDELFRENDSKKVNYSNYVYHSDEGTKELKRSNKEDFSKYLISSFKDAKINESDLDDFNFMKEALENRTFLPKQKDTNNRVIPHQLYWYELNVILSNASKYLDFLKEEDEEGLNVINKIESVFLFRIPYFVGPLNSNSPFAWLERKQEKIYPWNFEKVVDLDKSEQNFIQRMTNTCTYIPGEPVLPKDSLLYHKYTVLNELNNLKINGTKISVELKQAIYKDLFMFVKKVTKKKLMDYLICNGIIEKGEEVTVTGIDTNINSNLTTQIAFKRLMDNCVLSEIDVEKIVERASYAEDKSRLNKWIINNYPNVTEEDRKYICSLKLKDFGRLSRYFLSELEGTSKETGEITTIISALWNTQYNLMELLSDRFTFNEEISKIRAEYYADHSLKLDDRLDEMYISNAVRRPIYRTLDIVKDVTKAFGEPKKIFVEMTRGATEEQKGKRTKTRKEQILELYSKCNEEDVRTLKQSLEEMGDYADNKLQGDKLFLYYMQLGKSMYSNTKIDLNKLGSKEYDIDHIYPQAFVKDDSILNNKVLVLSSENGEKSDKYPIKDSIRSSMRNRWDYLKAVGLITEEKYKRLTRGTPFTEDEKLNFINRQLVETSQSTKAVATLLKEKYPDCEIVYCKAKLASEFRHEFDLLKSRTYNDLHHAVDAYLNIVTGNVYNMKFTKKWFKVDSNYSIKTRTIFTHPLVCNGQTIWDGADMLAKVKKTAVKNNAHFTKYSYFKKGGLFDQLPVSASEGLTPLKKELPTEKYGGYNKAGAMFFIPVRYKLGKKKEIIIMSVEMLYGKKFLEDKVFAEEYCFKRLKHILGKDVEEVSFPMGMRPWKVNTVLSLDGFRVCISGMSSGGKSLIIQPVMQFSSEAKWRNYLKRLESFVEKCSNNPNYIYDKDYDYVSYEENMLLYKLYEEKYANSIYIKRVNSPIEIIKKGENKFANLDIKAQCTSLLSIHQTFGRSARGCDLTLVGGSGRAASTANFSAIISNWKKNYKEVNLVDVSTSGLWEQKSENLLELI